MNNSQIIIETIEPKEREEKIQLILRAEEARQVKIIEAIRGIQATKEWLILKELVFDSLVKSLEKELSLEAKKTSPSTNQLNRLSGELKWAERYADLGKLEDNYKVNLQNIRIKLYGKPNE